MNIGELFDITAINLSASELPLVNTISDAVHAILAIALLIIAATIQRTIRAQLATAAQIADALSMQQRRADIDLFRNIDALESALARLLADGLIHDVQLSSNSLLCAVSPAPYLVVTNFAGERIFITQQPQLFRRLGVARHIHQIANLTKGIASRRATMQAIWDAACLRHSLPQPALPFNVDWHALVTHKEPR